MARYYAALSCEEKARRLSLARARNAAMSPEARAARAKKYYGRYSAKISAARKAERRRLNPGIPSDAVRAWFYPRLDTDERYLDTHLRIHLWGQDNQGRIKKIRARWARKNSAKRKVWLKEYRRRPHVNARNRAMARAYRRRNLGPCGKKTRAWQIANRPRVRELHRSGHYRRAYGPYAEVAMVSWALKKRAKQAIKDSQALNKPETKRRKNVQSNRSRGAPRATN